VSAAAAVAEAARERLASAPNDRHGLQRPGFPTGAAGVDALAPVVLVAPGAALVLPAGRFPSFVVLGISGVRLARGSA